MKICEFDTDKNSLSAKHAPNATHALCRCWNLWAFFRLFLLLGGYAPPLGGALHNRESEPQQAAASLLCTPATTLRWEQLALPSKRSEPFEAVHVLGQNALRVKANNSVSIFRQRFGDGVPVVGGLTFP